MSFNLEQQRKRAKDLKRAHLQGSLEAGVRIARHLPRARNLSPENVLDLPFTLSEAQLVVAREAGFPNWPKLKHNDGPEALTASALAGDDAAVDAALDRDPDAPRRSIYLAAAVARPDAAFELLAANPTLADGADGSRGWKPLQYLCSSRYRRGQLGTERAAIARRLIALGAAVSGRNRDFQSTHGTMVSPNNELFAIEAAAGRSASPELVRLLLESGADLKPTTVALLEAVRGGNIEILQMLLDALPSEVGWQANWAIQEAVVANRTDMARMLSAHVELPARDALLEAIRLGRDQEMLETLIGNGRPGPKTYRWAIRYGNAPAAGLLAQRGADQTAVTEVDRVLGACMTGDRTAVRPLPHVSVEDHAMLAWAIRAGRTEAALLMLEAGLDPAVAAPDGETPLHLAVRSAAAETVDALLRAGAPVNAENFDSETPLDLALTVKDGEARERIIGRLLASGARAGRPAIPDDLFERAADTVAFGDLEALRQMLDEEPSLVRARSPRPHRAMLIHYCGSNGVEEGRQRTPPNAPAILQLLLDRGADVNAACNLYRGGSTTLGLMLSSVHPIRAGLRTALAEILFQHGAGAYGTAAELCRAAALGLLDTVRRVYDPAGDQAGLARAFFLACEFGRTAVVEFLLDQGAQLQAQDGNGQTGLHLAALWGRLDTAKLLINRGAPLEIQNNWGGTVLSHVLWAALHHDPNVDYAPIVDAVVDAGAVLETGWADWWSKMEPLFPASKPGIEAALRRGEGH